MQYVRSISGSVSKTWNSINPATLSGAIDVIVVGQEDGTLACSPFHVRFGKFQLLRPSEKKVEFTVNNVKQQYFMKLGEGGEAFFVFETSDSVPEALQTSPLVSPAVSPQAGPSEPPPSIELAEPEPLDLALENARKQDDAGESRPPAFGRRTQSDLGDPTPRSSSPEFQQRPVSGDWSALPAPPSITRSTTEDLLPTVREALKHNFDDFEKSQSQPPEHRRPSAVGLRERSPSPPPVSSSEAVQRAISLSKKLWSSNIPTQISEYGDLMLDMTGYQTSEEQALKAELIARRILAEELEGNYDIGALIGADEKGNVWIYSSEEAKDKADRKAGLSNLNPTAMRSSDAISDPGYHSSDEIQSDSETTKIHRRDSDSAVGMSTPPRSPEKGAAGNPNKNYAKTLRLTSEQLKALDLKPGANPVSFTVNKATCQAFMYYWQYDVPIVISDIDGTITKSDALGHVLNMIGRDWTHLGVAKLYTDIASNGYHILYLTSRSVGQADTTRGYLNGVVQDGYRLPKGPVIMSPDRTMAALRREVYLRKPEVFKMACLRDIMALFGGSRNSPFYAGFGNRFTDALSYRSVNIPSTRIFTINSNAEVSLDLLSLNKYKTGYVSMREIVDHYFPPVALRVREGGEEFTDFNYWREGTLELDDFSASESEDEDEVGNVGIYGEGSVRSEDEGTEGISNYGDGEDEGEDLEASYFSRGSMDESGVLEDSIMESVEGDAYDEAALERSLLEEEDGTGEISVDGLGEDAAEQLEALDLASDVTPPRSRNGKASQRQAQGGHPHRAEVDKGEGSAMHVQTTP